MEVAGYAFGGVPPVTLLYVCFGLLICALDTRAFLMDFTLVEYSDPGLIACVSLFAVAGALLISTAAAAAVLSSISWSPLLIEAWLAKSDWISDARFLRQGTLLVNALRVLCALPFLLVCSLGVILLTVQPTDVGLAVLLLGPALLMAGWGLFRARALRWHFTSNVQLALASAACLLLCAELLLALSPGSSFFTRCVACGPACVRVAPPLPCSQRPS